MIEVVAGLIQVDSKYLIAKRTFGDAPAIGKWEFPGGKVEENESDEEAIKREILEEIGVLVDVKEYLEDCIQVYETRTIHLKLYHCVSKTNVFNINAEHTEYAIVDFEDIGEYDLAPADYNLYEKIKSWYTK